MDAPVSIRLHSIPLHQDVEGGHGVGQVRGKAFPSPVAHFFAAPHCGQHGEGGFHCHPHIPLTTLADFDVGGVSLGAVKAGVGQDNHLSVILGQ